MEIELTGFTILDSYGVGRLTLNGKYASKSLADLFVDNWIPYMECHKCGRSSYCKFTKPHPHNPHKKLEIKCGVAETAVRNFVERTFPIAATLDVQRLQTYLDGAFYLQTFVLEAEQSVGGIIDRDFLDWLGKYAPSTFGRLTHLRDTLNNLGRCFSKIPDFYSRRSLLLVEGMAEKAFLDKLRESHSSWFLHLLVECYAGKGNRRSKRIAMLLQKYVELGYTIYAQADADGNVGEIFKPFVDSGHLKKHNIFVFKFDFESAIPVALLFHAMKRIGIQIGFRPRRLATALKMNPKSVLVVLADQFGVDLNSKKCELAVAVAEILNKARSVWWQDDQFMNTELGKFLRFIQDMG